MNADDSRLVGFLPARWLQKSPDLHELVNAIGRPMDKWYNTAAGISSYFAPASAPEDWLNFLMYVVALPTADYLSVQQKRSIIAVAFKSWPFKGTKTALERVAQAICGPTAQLTNTAPSAFIAGWSLAGDIVGPGAAGFTWTLEISAAVTLTDDEIRRLLDPFKLAVETYTITRV